MTNGSTNNGEHISTKGSPRSLAGRTGGEERMDILPDQREAERFLKRLAPSDLAFTFQTFDDNKGRGDRKLAHVTHGRMDQLLPLLTNHHNKGAGVFVTINETDGNGRKAGNITRVRAIWQDDDDGWAGDFPLDPHITVESSPGKFQRIWLVQGMAKEQHKRTMETMVSRFGCDKNAKDIARVLRVPGFWHLKGEPFQVRIVEMSEEDPYPAEELMMAFSVGSQTPAPAPAPAPKAEPEPPPEGIHQQVEMLARQAAKRTVNDPKLGRHHCVVHLGHILRRQGVPDTEENFNHALSVFKKYMRPCDTQGEIKPMNWAEESKAIRDGYRNPSTPDRSKKPSKAPDHSTDEASPSDIEMGAEPPAPMTAQAFKFPDPFPGFMTDVVDGAISAAIRPQPQLSMIACLVGMAGSLAGHYQFDDGTRLNLYGLGIAESGDGKDLPLRLASVVADSASAEIIGRPASGQGLEDALVDDRGMLCALDEIGHLLKNMNDSKAAAYSVELQSNFLQLFSGSMREGYRCRAKAKNKGTPLTRTLRNPCLSLLGFTTPSSLSAGLNLQSIEAGLLGRFLFVPGLAGVRPKRATRKLSIPEVAGHDIHQATQSGREFVITQTPEATEMLDRVMGEFYEAELNAPTPEARALLRRSFEKVRRVSGVLAVWDRPAIPEVTVDHIDWATRLVQASDAALLQFAADRIHGSEALADAARVLNTVDRIVRGEIMPMTTAQVAIIKLGRRYAPKNLTLKATKLPAKQFNEACRHLVQTGELAEAEVATSRKTTSVLFRVRDE